MNKFSRATSAFVVMASLMASSMAAAGQTTTQKQGEPPAVPVLKKTPAQSDAAKTQTSTATEQADKKQTDKRTTPNITPAKRTLSTNEDPAMIGKRNINGGFIGKLSGSTEKEVRMGREAAAEVDRQAKFVDDPVITEYINRVGQNVVLHSDAKIPFTIKVIDSDEVNAFALPGGFFYVNKGLILAADDEAEVAGVMAHEIAHVAARHAMENQAKGMLAEIGLLAGSIFLGGIGGMLINNAAQFGALLGFMKFNRNAE